VLPDLIKQISLICLLSISKIAQPKHGFCFILVTLYFLRLAYTIHVYTFCHCSYIDDDDHVDGVRLRLWTAAINRPIVHPAGDIRAWRTILKWYRHGKLQICPPELSGSPISRETGKGNEISLRWSLHYFEGFFNMPWNVMTWGWQFYFPSEGKLAADFYRLCPGLNPRTLDPMTSTLTTRPRKMIFLALLLVSFSRSIHTLHLFCLILPTFHLMI
jgi:hypothetical protein